MKIDILTLFPEFFNSLKDYSIIGRAIEESRININIPKEGYDYKKIIIIVANYNFEQLKLFCKNMIKLVNHYET